MKALLIHPIFPSSFWSYKNFLSILNRKVLLPPLGLITAAGILPQEWEYRLVDINIRQVTSEEWVWAEIIFISAMIVQKEDFIRQILEAKKWGKPVAVGGPYPTSLPEEAKEIGADFLILDEGEITIPIFLDSLKKGAKEGTYVANGNKPDVTKSPIPRFDLLELDAYQNMSVQFSRGCPFQCEFCDIIVLYGRKPRTKSPKQLLSELEFLLKLGWERQIFIVDDNFIGNKRNVKLLLKELLEWQKLHRFPFRFYTEASIDLAEDQELMKLMVECGFNAVFLGIETPDEVSLQLTKKFQNTRNSLIDSVDKITRAGLIPMAGFILGFDNELSGAGTRIIDFVEKTSISRVFFTLLQALPNTALWKRLESENRLFGETANINQTHLINFNPTRPLEEIVNEYIQAFWELYEPKKYLERTYKCFIKLGIPKIKSPPKRINRQEVILLLLIMWRQGFKRNTRWNFWIYLFNIIRIKPSILNDYITVCASFEHFYEFRQIVKNQLELQLSRYLLEKNKLTRVEVIR